MNPRSDKGFVQAYNAQTAVDVDTMIIVETQISQAPNDKQEIAPGPYIAQCAQNEEQTQDYRGS